MLLSTNHSLTELDLWQGAFVMLIQTVGITELVFCRRQYAMGKNALVSFRVYVFMQYYERAKSIP
jgi:hypothetical protein